MAGDDVRHPEMQPAIEVEPADQRFQIALRPRLVGTLDLRAFVAPDNDARMRLIDGDADAAAHVAVEIDEAEMQACGNADGDALDGPQGKARIARLGDCVARAGTSDYHAAVNAVLSA